MTGTSRYKRLEVNLPTRKEEGIAGEGLCSRTEFHQAGQLHISIIMERVSLNTAKKMNYLPTA